MENNDHIFSEIDSNIELIKENIINFKNNNFRDIQFCDYLLTHLNQTKRIISNLKTRKSNINTIIINTIYKTTLSLANQKITSENINTISQIILSKLPPNNRYNDILDIYKNEKAELDSLKKSCHELYSQLENQLSTTQKTIDKQLEGAAQIGLAQAFLKRQKKLEKSKIIFLLIFFSGLSLIILASLHFVSTFEISTSNNHISIEAIIQHIFIKIYIIIPIVWATWFAARQYANVNKIAEDYAFKTTSAMSFVGYKKEVEHDTEMKRELLRTAINNFGENPTRLLNKKECVSPAQELFQAFELANGFYGKSKKDK